MDSRKSVFLLALFFLLGAYSSVFSAESIVKPEYILYVPEGIDSARQYPLVIALSPVADAVTMINTWKPIADEYQWIIFASKEVKNGVPFYSDVDSRLMKLVKELCSHYPIDTARIVTTGLSGGGQTAHAYSFMYPEVVSAVVVNTGKINEYFLSPEIKSKYPVRKIAVFLASPEDFRYQEMKEDCIFLESLGWRTKWIEFQGGHRLAPESAYKEAVVWLMEHF